MSLTHLRALQFTQALHSRRVTQIPFLRPGSQLRPHARLMAADSTNTGVKLDKGTPDEDWKNILSPEEFQVLRMKGTELPGSGQYNKFFEEGSYKCAGCDAPLFSSEHKFDSGCGWPAFYDELPGAIEREVDNSMGQTRTEVMCKNCGGHLGHVFEGEGFPTPTNMRHCVNSVSVKFEKK